jgi:hypothetical protein
MWLLRLRVSARHDPPRRHGSWPVGAGLHITGDRPLARVVLWSIRTVLSLEPYVAMTIEPGQEFTWQYTYTFYVIDNKK